MVARVCSSITEVYLTSRPARCIAKVNEVANVSSHIFDLAQSGAQLGSVIAKMRGNVPAAEKCHDIDMAIQKTDRILGVACTIFPLESILTGKMFWEQNDDGSWLHAQIDREGNFVLDAEENYIPDRGGPTPKRDYIAIVLDVLGLALRTLSLITFLHEQRVYDLKNHIQRIHHAVLGLSIANTLLCLIDDLCLMIKEQNHNERVKIGFVTACDLVDCAALPFSFGFGMKGPPALAITGLAIRALSSLLFLTKEAVFYDE